VRRRIASAVPARPDGLEPGRRLAFIAILIATSVGLSLVLAEIVVRVHLWNRPVSFQLVDAVYGQYDRRFGQRFRPNSRKVLSLVENGRVVWCPGVVGRANEDGLGGRSTLRDAARADYVIFTTGDSFSHWMRSALTVPDVVESVLREHTGLKVVNLNFARGAYGILQMLTLAAEMYPVVKPNLVVVQFISDDLTRGRWWTREAEIDGRTRSQISPRPDGFDDPRTTNEEDIVDPRATEAWCDRQLAAPVPDGVIRDAMAYHRAYLRAKGIAFEPFSLTKSYLIDAVWSGIFATPFYSQTAFSLMSRVTARQFAADPGYHDAVRRLKGFGVPTLLVHLPNKAEVLTGRPFRGREATAIWARLEADLGTRIVTLGEMEPRPAVPRVMDLQPNNAHPNIDGIRFYGAYVAAAIEPRLRRP